MRHIAATIFFAALASAPAQARDVRTEQVRFEPGASSAVVESSITGYETVDYVLRASQGQYTNISMATDNGASYFNILAPGETDVAMFNGSINDNHYEGILPESGAYKVRVYMMRSAARRDEVANYSLEMIITAGEDPSGSAHQETAAPNAATRAGNGDFDATGQISCAQAAGQPMAQCDFGVSREDSGTATVVVTRPDGTTRAIFFIDGKANSADTSQADGYPEFRAGRDGDLNRVRVGNERYEIPGAVIFGG